jgi:uncharacterized protein YggT (Ycf19 family)
MSTYNASSTKPIYFGTQIVWFIFGAIEILLALRFILKLISANATALFTDTIYSVTNVFVSPFTTVFRTTYQAGSAFEWTTLLAAFIYALIAFGIINLLLMSQDVSTAEAASRLRRQE